MPNVYCRLSDVKAELQGSGSGTSNDTVLLRVAERAARGIDEYCERHFYSRVATLLYPERARPPHVDQRHLWLPQDICGITTLKVDQGGDGTYETTLVANTDYWTFPYNRLTHEPIQRLDLNPSGVQISAWPRDVRSVQLVGKAGWSEETELATTTTEVLDDSETGIDLTSVANVSAGDTLIIDSEQIDVLSVSSLTATVTRGVNGTTAASHLTGATVYRRRFPREIELVAVMQTARFFREIQTGYGGSVGNAEVAGFSFRAMYPAIRDLLTPYVMPRAA